MTPPFGAPPPHNFPPALTLLLLHNGLGLGGRRGWNQGVRRWQSSGLVFYHTTVRVSLYIIVNV